MAPSAVLSGEATTASVIVDSFMEVGLDNMVGSTPAFINVDRDFLLSHAILNLPRDRVVLEVLETVSPDEVVLARMQELKGLGYRLALDDYTHAAELAPMLDLVSIVKIDISQYPADGIGALVTALSGRGLTLVAERVETEQEFKACLAAGFGLFQGFFLERPETISRGRAPDGNRLVALQTMALLNDERSTVAQLEDAISRDVMLSYRLLRLMNSAAYGVAGRVDSLHTAIVYLGRDIVRAWVSMLLLSGMNGKPNELLTKGLVRAKMCERLAGRVEPDLTHGSFTAGLFSILDAVLDTPMADLVEQLPLETYVSRALTDRDGPIGGLLAATIAYERCAWEELAGLSALTDVDLKEAYLKVLLWTRGLSKALAA